MSVAVLYPPPGDAASNVDPHGHAVDPLQDELSSFGIYQIDDVFDEKFTRICTYFGTFLSVTSMCFAVLLLYLVVAKTPPAMSEYKKLLMGSTVNLLLFSVVTAPSKSIILLPFPVFFSAGLFAPYPRTFNYLTIYFFYQFVLNIVDILLVMSIERYFAMTKSVVQHSARIKGILYSILFLTNVMLLPTLVVTYFIGIETSEKTVFYLKKHVVNLEYLLLFQDDLFLVTMNPTLYAILMGYTVSYSVYRTVLILYFLYKNVHFFVKHSSKFSKKVKKHHYMLVKTLVVQVVVFSLLLGFPILTIAISFIFKTPWNTVYLVCLLLVTCLPLADMLVTVFGIEPYRMQLYRLFCVSTPSRTGRGKTTVMTVK